ncbi:DUF6415 family natural product biosynthesis protein [Streptomyces sp. enrichment culture]|uniref:DUF6415 family natural product biosynthesis protein n=1 Tax=Streptomyces sp. enrichment culture TaxID=1795815 RepID=UPI003F55474A
MNAAIVPLSARYRMAVPDRDGLTRRQRQGGDCVWCGLTLGPETAIDLGHRSYKDEDADYWTSWWPRGCRSCVAHRAPMPVDTLTMRREALRGLGKKGGMSPDEAAMFTLTYRGMALALVPAVRDAVDHLEVTDPVRRAAETDIARLLTRVDRRPRTRGAAAAHTHHLARLLARLLDHLDRHACTEAPA